MKNEIVLRVLSEADFVIKTEYVVRKVAKVFNVSKSTVHYDLRFRLNKIDRIKWQKVSKILEKNLSQRHIRGGIATREKYKNITKNN